MTSGLLFPLYQRSGVVDDDPAARHRVVIADALRLFRACLRRLLEAEPDFCVVGEAGDGDEALALVRAGEFDLLLIDLALPGVGVRDVLRQLPEEPSRAIVLAATGTRAQLIDAARVGARAIVHKDATPQHLLRAMRAVVGGDVRVDRAQVSQLTRQLAHQDARPVEPAGTSQPPTLLTQRERDIIRHVAQGAVDRDIAGRFGLHEQTVKNRLSAIRAKLGLSSRRELVVYALHHGLAGNGRQ